MKNKIQITKTQNTRLATLDFNNIPFGRVFTDHMFVVDYEGGEWVNPRIEPFGSFEMHPASMVLHYGQAIFEGMKVTMGQDQTPLLFRPEKNAARLNKSADRMGMPEFPEDLFLQGLLEFVRIERNWVPSQEGSALYLRPFMYADESFIGMRAATHYKFIIMASPAGPYFNRRIRLYAETQYVRAVNGGTGEAKAAGNYAAAIRPTEFAKAKGYDQVLWLDPNEFEYVQEVGTMNIFFKIAGTFYTPDLSGSILAGVTRMSVIELLKHKGYEVVERPISLTEIKKAIADGTLEEGFGVGTAVGIALIDEIGNEVFTLKFPESNPVGDEINTQINEIKVQKSPDVLHWLVSVK